MSSNPHQESLDHDLDVRDESFLISNRESSFLDKWPGWLRWICLLPFAFASYILIQIFFGMMSSLVDWSEGLSDFISQAVNSAAGPYALIKAGAFTAPTNKLPVAISLAVFYGIATGFIAASVIFRRAQQLSSIWFWISIVIGLVAAIMACIQVYKEEVVY